MKRAIGFSAATNTKKNALLVLAALSVGILSCNNGVSIEKEFEGIRFGREGSNGFTGDFESGTYIDSKGNIYRVSSPATRPPNSQNGYQDSLTSWVLSQGVLLSDKVPHDSLLLMDSLLIITKLDTQSVSISNGNDLGQCNWFAFDPISSTNHDTPIVLKTTGSWEYHLVSESAVQLAAMIEKYCKN